MQSYKTFIDCNSPINNENGVAIVTVLLILMLLTFIGITSTNTTITEKKMVRSLAVFERDFSLAESAAMEGVQKIANESTPEELLAPLVTSGANNDGLLVSADPLEPENDIKNLDANGDAQIDRNDFSGAGVTASEVDAKNLTFRKVVQLPIASGDSLGLGASRVYSYAAYGFSENSGGRAMIKVGYKKRF
jgi:hypothetical protein